MVKTEFSSQQQDMLFALEDESWWFTYRIRLIEKLLEKYFTKMLPLIDLGGGNGYSARTSQFYGGGFARRRSKRKPGPGAVCV